MLLGVVAGDRRLSYSLPVARPCSVCNHPDRGQVEAELLQGISLRTVGGRHGLSASALQRHRTTHMAAIPEAEPEAKVARM